MWSGAERRDRVRDRGHDTAPASRSVGVHVDRAQVIQHGVQALVGDVPEAIDIIGKPRQPTRKTGRDDIDLSRGIDDRAHRRRQLPHASDRRISDKQQPPERPQAVLLVMRSGVVSHGPILGADRSDRNGCNRAARKDGAGGGGRQRRSVNE